MSDIQEFSTTLAQSICVAGGRAQVSPNGAGVDAVVLPNGRAIGWRMPTCSTLDNVEPHLAARAVVVARDAAAAVAQLERDHSRLNETARREVADGHAAALEKVARDALTQFEKIDADTARRVAEFTIADHETYSVPRAADGVAAAEDGEVRSRVRAMTPEQQGALVERLAQGETPRVLHALLRDPMGLPPGLLADALPRAWRSALAKSSPELVAGVEAARERVGWLQQVVQQARDALPSAPRRAEVRRAA